MSPNPMMPIKWVLRIGEDDVDQEDDLDLKPPSPSKPEHPPKTPKSPHFPTYNEGKPMEILGF